MPNSTRATQHFSEALELVHAFYHRTGLCKESGFVDPVRDTTCQILILLHGQASMDQSIKAAACFLRAFRKPLLSPLWVEKYAQDDYLQSVVAAFSVACLCVWFDRGFGTHICSIEVLGFSVYKDNLCPKIEKYNLSFLLAVKQLYLYASHLLKIKIASLPRMSSVVSKKLVSHLSS